MKFPDHIALVLEGGGMRGAFTCGALDYFMDRGIEFPYAIGVSAGACHGLSYMSRQRGRSRIASIEMMRQHRLAGLKYLWTQQSVLNQSLIYDAIPNGLVPFDFDAFFANPATFEMVTTDCLTGQPLYLSERSSHERLLDIVRASSSLPFVCPIVDVRITADASQSDGAPAVPKGLRRRKAERVVAQRATEVAASLRERLAEHLPAAVRERLPEGTPEISPSMFEHIPDVVLPTPADTLTGVPMLDGGIVDSIPVLRAFATGHSKCVCVLTRERGFRSKERDVKMPRFVYRNYPRLRVALSHRVRAYNAQLALVERLEAEGRIVCIRPEKPVEVDRLETNLDRLTALYDEGYVQARRFFELGDGLRLLRECGMPSA